MYTEVMAGSRSYWYMLETTVHMTNKSTKSNNAIHATVDFLYHYLARELRFAQGMEDINGLFEDTQAKIEAAEEANTALEDKEISAAYSPMAIRLQERTQEEEEAMGRGQEETVGPHR